MTPQTLAQKAYAQAHVPISTPRDTEYDAISRITHRLKSAASKQNVEFGRFAEALHENRRLWTLLATEVADKENALPEDLRARIFYLAEFTHYHSGLVLSGKATVDPLVEINLAVMRGLRRVELAA